MDPIKPHFHNDTDSPKLPFQDSIVNAPQAAVTEISQTAGALYTANEQAMLNQLKSSLNDLIDKLQVLGVLK